MTRFRFDLKGLRSARRVSQLQLSVRSGVGRWRIRMHELGAIDLRPDELEKIVDVLRQAEEADRTQLQQTRELAERLG